MLKKLALLSLVVPLALSACGTLQVNMYQTPTPLPSPTFPPALSATPTPLPATPADVAAPRFSDPSFFRAVGHNPGCSPVYQHLFPARLLRVYASWAYSAMSAADTVRYEWYHDGELWAGYNEPWNFAKYGANGTVADTFIYDLDAGLPPGRYELRLYIDGQPQFSTKSNNSFVVDPDWTLEIASPNNLLTAIISQPEKLMLREPSGTKWERLRANEISSLAWLPDSHHLLYTDTDRSATTDCGTRGVRYRLWLLDVATGIKNQIGQDVQNLHDPQISTDGHYVAALGGTDWADACAVDTQLAFIELDAGLNPVASVSAQMFAGLPAAAPGSLMYPVGRGTWQDATHYQTGLSWTCPSGADPSGTYLFDLPARQASRAGDLPPTPAP